MYIIKYVCVNNQIIEQLTLLTALTLAPNLISVSTART